MNAPELLDRSVSEETCKSMMRDLLENEDYLDLLRGLLGRDAVDMLVAILNDPERRDSTLSFIDQSIKGLYENNPVVTENPLYRASFAAAAAAPAEMPEQFNQFMASDSINAIYKKAMSDQMDV